GERGLLHDAIASREEQDPPLRVLLEVHDGADALLRGDRDAGKVRRVEAACRAARLGHLVDLDSVDLAAVREEQQPVVRRRREDLADDVLLLEILAANALPAAALAAERLDRLALHVARAGDG